MLLPAVEADATQLPNDRPKKGACEFGIMPESWGYGDLNELPPIVLFKHLVLIDDRAHACVQGFNIPGGH